jgi:hypothetical protein
MIGQPAGLFSFEKVILSFVLPQQKIAVLIYYFQ